MDNEISRKDEPEPYSSHGHLSRGNILLGSTALAASAISTAPSLAQVAPQAQTKPAQASGTRPNILVIFGDDIGQMNVSAYSFGLMGYPTPNIDRIAREGMITWWRRCKRIWRFQTNFRASGAARRGQGSNWLPAPRGADFSLFFGAYWPKAAVVETPPAVQRLK